MTPQARTSTESRACSAAPSEPGRSCPAGIRSGRPRWPSVANRTTVPCALDQQALHLLWKEGASVVINWDSRLDERCGRLSPEVGPARSGIFFADGRPKPAYTAFRFPFVTERIDKRRLLAWGKAPAGGKLVIQRRQRGRWIAAKKLKVGQGPVFHRQAAARSSGCGRRWRASEAWSGNRADLVGSSSRLTNAARGWRH